MRATGFGWGKIILFGEHAVVYGYPAIAAMIDRGVHVTIGASDQLRIAAPCWGLALAADDDPGHPVDRAVRAIAAHLGVADLALRIDIVTSLPAGGGLGSSAALCVAVAEAIGHHAGCGLTRDAIGAAADVGEAVFHHPSSGLDVALATHGGAGVFHRGTGLAPLAMPALRLLVASSGEQRSTAAMVARVAVTTGGLRADARLVALGEITQAAIPLLVAEPRDDIAVGRLLDAAHVQLAALGVSTPRLDELRDAALAAGALGCKLTGAGGGGALIALTALDDAAAQDAVSAAWQALGASVLVATVLARRLSSPAPSAPGSSPGS